MRSEWAIGLRTAVLNNKGAKMLSLVLGAITWYAIQETINFEAVIADVPLVIQVDSGWAVLDRSTDTVDVHFRGSQEDLLRLNRQNVEVAVDVRGRPHEGVLVLNLGAKDVRAPGGTRPVYVRPNTVTFSVDREGEKQVPVKADIQGSPPEGYEVEKVVCSPASVSVRGPRLRLEEIESLRTAPIDLEGRLRSFRLRAQVIPPSETWAASVDPNKVTAEVTIVERSASKTLEEIPVKVLTGSGVRGTATVQPAKIAVRLMGRQEWLDKVGAGDVDAYVDCSGLDPAARYDLPVRVYAPPGVTVAATEPATVSVVQGGR
ncbi:MAG: hypothetical protein JXB04_00830 [Kiritimatiellae bacterium]|nr:hypothetical protein [Kiritimatiellia bacterium]